MGVVNRVRVLPADISFEVNEDESIRSAALRQGLTWPSVCDGMASCVVCAFRTVAGFDALLPMEAAEESILRAKGRLGSDPATSMRLACQTKLKGDVTITKAGVRRAA